MVKEEIIRKENKEVSELLLTIFKNVKNEYQEKEINELKRVGKERAEKYDIQKLFKEANKKVEVATEEIPMLKYKESIFKKFRNWFRRTLKK